MNSGKLIYIVFHAFSNISFTGLSYLETFESLRAKIYLTFEQSSFTALVFAYSGTNNAEMLPCELHVPTTSSYNIPDVSRFRYLRISQRLPIMFPRDVLDIVCTVFGKCTLPTLHSISHFYLYYISTIVLNREPPLRYALKK